MCVAGTWYRLWIWPTINVQTRWKQKRSLTHLFHPAAICVCVWAYQTRQRHTLTARSCPTHARAIHTILRLITWHTYMTSPSCNQTHMPPFSLLSPSFHPHSCLFTLSLIFFSPLFVPHLSVSSPLSDLISAPAWASLLKKGTWFGLPDWKGLMWTFAGLVRPKASFLWMFSGWRPFVRCCVDMLFIQIVVTAC